MILFLSLLIQYIKQAVQYTVELPVRLDAITFL